MFTGLVETRGTVVLKEDRPEGVRLVVEAAGLVSGMRLGDSVAVNGCCLTVVGIEGEKIAFDLLRETEERTNLKAAVPGAPVNLERALPADGRLGGHFVTGHIDGTGRIARWEQSGRDYVLEVEVEPASSRYLVEKGCIAIDGISLTVAAVSPAAFIVWIIPHTRAVTALEARKVGDSVNLEFDLLAKYTEKIVSLASR